MTADLIATWAPLVILLAVVLFVLRRGGMHARSPSGRTLVELSELYIEEMKRNTAALERIAQALEDRYRRPA